MMAEILHVSTQASVPLVSFAALISTRLKQAQTGAICLSFHFSFWIPPPPRY